MKDTKICFTTFYVCIAGMLWLSGVVRYSCTLV